MKVKSVCIIASVALFLAIFALPYGYYTLLRFFIFILGGFVSYKFFISKLSFWGWSFAVVSYLFNPIFPVYLSKSTWIFIDLISAVLFALAAYSAKPEGRNK